MTIYENVTLDRPLRMLLFPVPIAKLPTETHAVDLRYSYETGTYAAQRVERWTYRAAYRGLSDVQGGDVTFVDQHTFSVYRTVYFKDGEKVKTVVADWQSLDQEDPRINYPRYVYAITHTDGRDSMVFVPRSTIELNTDLPDTFWSAETLKTYGR